MKYLTKLEVGDIIFVRGNDLIAKAIRYFTDGDSQAFTHVCICVSDDNQVLETDIMTNAKITDFIYDDYEIVRFELNDEQKLKIQEIAPTLVGRHYDYWLILSFVLKKFFGIKPFNSPRDMICSEIVDYILYEIGVMPDDDYLNGESPNDMYVHIMQLKKEMKENDNS